jgi:N-acetylmuramoyl-L-alanine amidase
VIGNVRVAQFKPNVVRLVMDLQQEVDAQVFVQAPVGAYQHRLLVDLTPRNAPDPIAEFLAELEKKQPPRTAAVPLSRPWVIALDPGHGGEDPGAIGPTGLQEKEVTLAIALNLKERLEQRKRAHVLLTREADYFVPLAERVKKARAVNADLFLSVHADAFTRPEASGSSVYTLSEKGASSAAARYLASKENQADLVGGLNHKNIKDPVLAEMLMDLSQGASKQDSLSLADKVLKQMGKINKLHKKQVEHAGFVVLRAPDIPSILLETAFISNPEEEEKLRDVEFRNRICASLEQALVNYSAQKKFASRAL